METNLTIFLKRSNVMKTPYFLSRMKQGRAEDLSKTGAAKL